jgi:hypothetical protein
MIYYQRQRSHNRDSKSNLVWAGPGKYRLRFALTRWQWRSLEVAAALNRPFSKSEVRRAA